MVGTGHPGHAEHTERASSRQHRDAGRRASHIATAATDDDGERPEERHRVIIRAETLRGT